MYDKYRFLRTKTLETALFSLILCLQFFLLRALLKTSFALSKQFNKLLKSAIFKYIFIFNWHIVIEHIYGQQCDIAINVYNE